ncbi:MAG: hypothetical protein Q8P67_08440, partial [archaeon]|nr:hypothetical protein [archaeon]
MFLGAQRIKPGKQSPREDDQPRPLLVEDNGEGPTAASLFLPSAQVDTTYQFLKNSRAQGFLVEVPLDTMPERQKKLLMKGFRLLPAPVRARPESLNAHRPSPSSISHPGSSTFSPPAPTTGTPSSPSPAPLSSSSTSSISSLISEGEDRPPREESSSESSSGEIPRGLPIDGRAGEPPSPGGEELNELFNRKLEDALLLLQSVGVAVEKGNELLHRLSEVASFIQHVDMERVKLHGYHEPLGRFLFQYAGQVARFVDRMNRRQLSSDHLYTMSRMLTWTHKVRSQIYLRISLGQDAEGFTVDDRRQRAPVKSRSTNGSSDDEGEG